MALVQSQSFVTSREIIYLRVDDARVAAIVLKHIVISVSVNQSSISFTMASSTPHPEATRREGSPSGLSSTLPDGTSYTTFTSMKDIQSLVDFQIEKYSTNHLSSPFIVITEVSPVAFLQEFDKLYIDKGPRITADLKSRTIILETMVLYPHEIFSRLADIKMDQKSREAGWRSSITPLGAGRVDYENWRKEPDSSWGPISSKSSTIVLEVGLSESDYHLSHMAQGWLETDGSKINLVITADINRRTPLIVVRQWEKVTAQSSRSITRNYRNLMVASQTTEIRISHQDGRTRVTGGDLNISAENMLNRPPNAGEAVSIRFTHHELEEMAEEVWVNQGFM